MTRKGNERLDCANASNPYHVCSEHCSGQKAESKKEIVRNNSGDGALKYSGERKRTVRSDCTNGSNPYHECNKFCTNRTTQSGKPKNERESDSSGEAKEESRPKPPREFNVPLTNAVSSKPQVTKPHVSPEEKIDLRNGDYIKPYAEETCFIEDSLTIEEQNKFSQLILVSADALKADNLQNPRKTDGSSITAVKSKEYINTKPDEISEIVQDPSVHDEEEGDHKTASPNTTSFFSPSVARNHEETCSVENSLTIEEQNKFSPLILVSADALKADNLQNPRKTDVSLITAVKSKEYINTKPDEISEIVQDPSVRAEEEGDHKTASPTTTSFLSPSIARNHEETCFVQDSLTIEEQNKFSQLILVSANSLKADNLQIPHKTDGSSITSVKSKEYFNTRPDEIVEIVQDPSVHDEEEGDHVTASPNTTSFLSPSIARNHDESEEEVKSVHSEPSVPVGKYYIKASLAPILQSIFNKHGDIAASCKLESVSIRSYYLECVCYIIQELQLTKVSQKVSKFKVRELLPILNDVVSSEMNVGWLQSILNNVAEAVESGGQQWTLEVAKANCDQELELTKKELESQLEDLARKEKEMSDAKAKVDDARTRLSELELKYFHLNEEISSLQSKVNDLECKVSGTEL